MQACSFLHSGFARTRVNHKLKNEDALGLEEQFSLYESCFPHITPDQWGKLLRLAESMLEWNTKVNLISRKDALKVVPNHIVPCLAVSLVRRFDHGEKVIDVGTGGGLPGIPMSIINPEANVTLLDSNSKKMMVVNDLCNTLSLDNVQVRCARAEALEGQHFDFMLGRAVSAMPNFLSFSSHLITPVSRSPRVDMPVLTGDAIGSGLLYLKGGDFSNELAEAKITVSTKYAVRDLVPGLMSDKYVLHIPGEKELQVSSSHLTSMHPHSEPTSYR